MLDDTRLESIQERLGYRFQNVALLRRAMTHRTWIEEQHPGGHAPAHLSNQRLEFLGDALLGYVIASWLHEQLETADEGHLTGVRIRLVDQAALLRYAERLGLGPGDLQLGVGERQRVATNRRLLADTVEAIIAAVLLDGGSSAATALIHRLLPDEPPPPAPIGNPVSVLNQWCQQKLGHDLPEGAWDHEGPDHCRTWYWTIEVDGFYCEGSGGNKDEARRDTCRQMLAFLGVPGWGCEVALVSDSPQEETP